MSYTSLFLPCINLFIKSKQRNSALVSLTAQPSKKEGDYGTRVSSKVPKLFNLLFEISENFAHSPKVVYVRVRESNKNNLFEIAASFFFFQELQSWDRRGFSDAVRIDDSPYAVAKFDEYAITRISVQHMNFDLLFLFFVHFKNMRARIGVLIIVFFT
ncbi:MAG: hypothetical protein ACE5HX_09405, partial [bacterium]